MLFYTAYNGKMFTNDNIRHMAYATAQFKVMENYLPIGNDL